MEIEAIWINGIVLYGWSFDITSYDHHEIKYKIDRIRQTHWYGSGPPKCMIRSVCSLAPKIQRAVYLPGQGQIFANLSSQTFRTVWYDRPGNLTWD